MGWFRVLVLTIVLLLPLVAGAKERRVCIIDSYGLEVTDYVKKHLKEVLEKKKCVFPSSTNACDVEVLLGPGAVAKALKKKSRKKEIYTFVMFPEVLGLEKKENFVGVRIFPLPKETAEKFFSYTKLKKEKVAVPISKEMLSIAKRYLPDDTFDVLPFSDDITAIYSKLGNYDYVYIFPDPKLLRVVNILNLVRFCKENGKILITGLPDLDKYDVNFVYAVDYDALVYLLAKLVEMDSKKGILPCPAKVKVWNR